MKLKNAVKAALATILAAGCVSIQTPSKIAPEKKLPCVSRAEAQLEERVVRILNGDENSSNGSGFVGSKKILSAAHVIKKKDLKELNVTAITGEQYPITGATYSFQYDLALLDYKYPNKYKEIPNKRPEEGMQVFFLRKKKDTKEGKSYKKYLEELKDREQVSLDYTEYKEHFEIRGKVTGEQKEFTTKEGIHVLLDSTTLLTKSGDSGSMIFEEKEGCIYKVGLISAVNHYYTYTDKSKKVNVGFGRIVPADKF